MDFLHPSITPDTAETSVQCRKGKVLAISCIKAAWPPSIIKLLLLNILRVVFTLERPNGSAIFTSFVTIQLAVYGSHNHRISTRFINPSKRYSELAKTGAPYSEPCIVYMSALSF